MPNPQSPIPNLPPLRGRVRTNAELAKVNWFQVGGPAEILFWPEDVQDLADFISRKPKDMKVTVLGVGSNLLVRDGGIEGVVVRLGRAFNEVSCELRVASCEQTVTAGAAVLSLNAALFARDHGIARLEFLSGIPGTIGGALAMNAGAYGADVSQVLIEAELVDEKGAIRTLPASEIGYIYRGHHLPKECIFTRGTFRGTKGDREEIGVRITQIQAEREASQPIKSRTGGSTFKNPPGHKAWQLIDEAGCRGLTMGGAQVSEKHCNFLINTGNATAADLENLGEEVRRRVREHSGVELEWEIKRVGRF